jgi:hypothetical protein
MKQKKPKISWIKLELNQSHASLLDVITTGGKPYTPLGVNNWKSAFKRDNKSFGWSDEGVSLFNATVYVRLGAIYNTVKEKDLFLSYLGFGTWGGHGSVSCGFGRKKPVANQFVNKPAFCYILVQ